MKMNKIKNVVLFAAAALAVSGCSIQPSDKESWWYGSQHIDYLTAESAAKVRHAQTGDQIALVDMNQQKYQVTVQSRYFSASGKNCLNGNAQNKAIVICDYEGNRWGISRGFSQFESQEVAE